MPLDIGFGGGDRCPACGNSGMTEDQLSARELEEIIGEKLPKGAVITYAHATRCCDCRHGQALKKKMHRSEPDQ